MTAGLVDRRHRDLTRAVHQILWAWPHAHLDAHTRGYPTPSDGGTGNGHADPTSTAALTTTTTETRAETWLTAWAQLRTTLWPSWIVHGPHITNAGRDLLTAALTHHRPPRDTVDEVWRLANQALAWWPPPPAPSTRRTGLRVGPDDDGSCGLCGLPAPSGRDYATGRLLARTIDGVRYHATSVDGEHQACFWIRWRQRRGI